LVTPFLVRSIVVAVVPGVIPISVGLLGDVGRQAALGQLRFELFADPRLLVWIEDLLIFDALRPPREDSRRTEGDVAGGRLTDIEVLMVQPSGGVKTVPSCQLIIVFSPPGGQTMVYPSPAGITITRPGP
jgi:hypothetical protein